MGWVWYWYGMIWNGLVCSIMSNASLCFILDEGLETFLEIRDLEIYILLIYMVVESRVNSRRTRDAPALRTLYLHIISFTNIGQKGV